MADENEYVEYGVDVPMPYHLDLSNPALSECSGCGRSTWSASELGQTCGMPQPSGARCGGIFPAPTTTHPRGCGDGEVGS